MRLPRTLRAHVPDIPSRQEVNRVGLKHKLIPHAESEEEPGKVLDGFAEQNW